MNRTTRRRLAGGLLLTVALAAGVWFGVKLIARAGRMPVREEHVLPGGERRLFADGEWKEALDGLLLAFPDRRALAFDAIDPDEAEEGRRLAETLCGNCHLLPAPDLFHKVSWVDVFRMKRRYFPQVGLLDFEPNDADRREFEQVARLGRANMWGGSWDAPVSNEAFFRILQYYLYHAPLHPYPQENKPETMAAAPFEVRPVPLDASGPGFSAVAVDGRRILLGALDGSVLETDADGHIRRRQRVPAIPMHLLRDGADLLVTLIGDSIASESAPEGARLSGSVLRMIDWFDDGGVGVKTLLTDLYRPLRVHLADLGAGRSGGEGEKGEGAASDALVYEFGHLFGSLDWYRYDRAKSRMTLHRRLVDAPGTVGVHVGDMDGDGLPDITALLSQAREGLVLFRNAGDGTFGEEMAFQKPPSFAYTGLAVADVNGDGAPDVITANGDNGDLVLAVALRRYHGVRVHLNDGKGHFAKSFFYPMHGVGQVLAEDFTGDGRIDLAAIALFPDPKAVRAESFVLLENTGAAGAAAFTPRNVPAVNGKPWMAMASGDLQGRGVRDIVLSTLAGAGGGGRGAGIEANLIVLSNTSRRQIPPD